MYYQPRGEEFRGSFLCSIKIFSDSLMLQVGGVVLARVARLVEVHLGAIRLRLERGRAGARHRRRRQSGPEEHRTKDPRGEKFGVWKDK